MKRLDWLALDLYFVLMLAVGIAIRSRVKNARDFFTAGGSMPWWLAGISHHMSGYSAAVFVGYAALAYTEGFSLYIWWACSIAISLLLGANVFAVRWVRLRICNNMISPLEYLSIRYGPKTKLCLACSGSTLKIFDVGAKLGASALLLQIFANVHLLWGVLLIGGVTLVYSVAGGLWADAATDLSQFLIQLVSGICMCIAVLSHLGGIQAVAGIWRQLPPSHRMPFHGQYTASFAIAFLFVNLLSYNGGTWSLAQRFMAAPDPASARRSALLSAALYLVWPLVLFYPMWAAPLLLPNLPNPADSYALLAKQLLPAGLIGLVLAGLVAHSMAMTSSDANAVSAVIVRDILPAIFPADGLSDERKLLRAGRISTLLFLAAGIIIALLADRMGGILGLILLWYGALVGPGAVPMLLGMLPAFARCGAPSALAAWLAGIISFALLRWFAPASIEAHSGSLVLSVAGPALISFLAYVFTGLVWPINNPQAQRLLAQMQQPDMLPHQSLIPQEFTQP